MLYLTKHEKSALFSLAVIVLCGSLLNFAFTKNLRLLRWLNEEDRFSYKTDVNRAPFDELVRVPYIGEKSADKIIEHRQKFGTIQSLNELGLITHLSPASLEKAGKYLKI